MADLKPANVALATLDTRIRVEFSWERDRFAHRFLVDEVESATSVEGDVDDLWPASPPLQQLSLEEIDGREVILGVGSAGRSHWSVSIEVDQHQGRWIHFDWACRCKEEPQFLGNTYQLSEPIRCSLVDEQSCAVDREATDEEGSPVLVIRTSKLQTGTCRWSYRFESVLSST